MKRLLLLIGLFLMLGTTFCCGQGKVARLKLWGDMSHNNYAYSPRSNGVCNITLGLRREGFLNSNFYANKASGIIKPATSSAFISYSIFPLNNIELEGEYYTAYYDFNAPDISSKKVSHKGLEIFANVYVLPPLGEWTSIVCPFVGIGYQTSSLKAVQQDYSSATGGLIAKGGIRLYVLSRYVLRVEYKQTLPVGSEKLFCSLEFGFGLTM